MAAGLPKGARSQFEKSAPNPRNEKITLLSRGEQIMIKTWEWVSAHYQSVIGILIACSSPIIAWFTFGHKYIERKLNNDKEHILVMLRSEMAFLGLNGQTLDQIISNSKTKFSRKRAETILRNLANENPPRIHCFGGRFYLGPLPSEIIEMLLKQQSSRFD